MKIYGPIEQVQLENVASASPSPTPTGRVYCNTTAPASAIPMFYNGSVWQRILTGPSTSGGAAVSGSAYTVDWSTGNIQKVNLTGHCVFTFTNPQEGQEYTLIVKQDDSTIYHHWLPKDVYLGDGKFMNRVMMYGQYRTYRFQYSSGTVLANSVFPYSIPTGYFTPGGTGSYACALYKTAFSNGRMLAVGQNASAFIDVFQVTDFFGLGAKYAQPSPAPAGTVTSLAFTDDGTSILWASSSTPYLGAYQFRDVGFGANYSAPTALAGTVNQIKYSLKAGAVACAVNVSPYLTVVPFGTQSGFGSNSSPGTPPAGAGQGVSWTPDGAYVALAHTTTPFCSVYPVTAGVVGTKVANPGTLPNGNATAVAFSNRGDYLAVGMSVAPYIKVYSWSAGTWGSPASAPASNPAGTVTRIIWTPGDDYIILGLSSSPYLCAYPFSGGAFGGLINSSALIGAVTDMDMSFDGRVLYYTTATSTYVAGMVLPTGAKNYLGFVEE